MTALEGRTALVTGAAGGIGREVALLLGRLGANVVVNDPGVHLDGSGGSAGPAEEVAQAIVDEGGSAVPETGSVATPEGGAAMIQKAVDSFGRIDAVIHAAGILRDRMVFNMATEEWDAVIAVHLAGYFHLVRPASQLMRQQRFGRLIGFSSSSGLIGNSGQANYGAAKAGIAGMTRCLAADLGRYAVTSNAIAPTADTRMTQSVPETARSARAGSASRRLRRSRRRPIPRTWRRWSPTSAPTRRGTSTAASSTWVEARSRSRTRRSRCARSTSRRRGRSASWRSWCRRS